MRGHRQRRPPIGRQRQQQGENSSSNKNLYASNPVTLLDGSWLLVTDPNNVGREQKWFTAAVAGGQARPGAGNFSGGFPGYHGVVWYWREFTPPAHPYAQGRYLLSFGAVAYLAEVWVNGVSDRRPRGFGNSIRSGCH